MKKFQPLGNRKPANSKIHWLTPFFDGSGALPSFGITAAIGTPGAEVHTYGTKTVVTQKGGISNPFAGMGGKK